MAKKKVIKKTKNKPAVKPSPKHLGTRWKFSEVNYRSSYITKGYYLTGEEGIWEPEAADYISLNEPYIAEPYPKPKD